jgi:hypothetical protein
MNAHFSHSWSSGLEVFAALALGFWLGTQHAWLSPRVIEFVLSLLGT